ncbi:hypothetical protein DL95DRAFT_335111 [Leptodontidium sp. 2 PMI_412]|nr:hypothetical protein DL95DRAFT_335111 [Leptodontidium sp. 2 PMI_412]
MAQNKYTSKLAGSHVLIIGGTSGVGYAVAEASIAYGAATVVISSSKVERVNASVSRLRDSYPTTQCQVLGVPCDLKQEDALESNITALFETATSNGTRKFDHIIFTAGDHPVPRHLSQINFNFIKEAGLVRFFGPLLVAKHAANHMVPGLASSFTLTSGVGGRSPYPNWNVFGAYNAALEGIMRSLAVELKPVRVNLVCLGPIDTELIGHFFTGTEERKGFLDGFAVGSVTGTIGKAEDAAEAYIYCMKVHNLAGSVVNSNAGMLLLKTAFASLCNVGVSFNRHVRWKSLSNVESWKF